MPFSIRSEKGLIVECRDALEAAQIIRAAANFHDRDPEDAFHSWLVPAVESDHILAAILYRQDTPQQQEAQP